MLSHFCTRKRIRMYAHSHQHVCALTHSHTGRLRHCIKWETHLAACASVALSGPWFHYLSVFSVTRRKVTSDLPQDQFVCKSVRNWRAIEGWHNKSCFWACEQVSKFGRHSGPHRDTNGAHLSNRTLWSAGHSLQRILHKPCCHITFVTGMLVHKLRYLSFRAHIIDPAQVSTFLKATVVFLLLPLWWKYCDLLVKNEWQAERGHMQITPLSDRLAVGTVFQHESSPARQ